MQLGVIPGTGLQHVEDHPGQRGNWALRGFSTFGQPDRPGALPTLLGWATSESFGKISESLWGGWPFDQGSRKTCGSSLLLFASIRF